MATKKSKTKKIDESNFEERLQRLQEIVTSLEDTTIPLEMSIQLYKEGITLSRLCRTQLEKAQHEVKLVTDNGTIEPFEFQDIDLIRDNE